MAVIQQQPTFNQQAADIQHQKKLAEMLRAQSKYDMAPNASVSVGPYTNVIPMSPIAALAQGLREGVASYNDASAAKQEAELADKKQQALSTMFSGENDPTMQDMAQSGLFGGDVLVNALLKKQQAKELAELKQQAITGDGYHPPIATSQGYAQYNPQTRGWDLIKQGESVLMPGQYDPNNKYEVTKAGEKAKFSEVELPDGRKTRMPNEQVNSIYNNSKLPPVFDFKNPEQANLDLANGQPVDIADAAQAKYDAWRRDNGMIAGQSTAEKEGIKTAENIKQKEAEAKIGLETDKAKTQQDRQSGALKTSDTLTDMMRYLYPNGQPVRSADGRLAPPSQQMILGTGPLDRLQMVGQNIGIHSDQATNTERLRSKASELVTAASNGKLGGGVSNADMDILRNAQGVLDRAQDQKTIYEAVSDIEQTVNRILQNKDAKSSPGPQIGTIEDGHRFKGGNPADPNNWELVR